MMFHLSRLETNRFGSFHKQVRSESKRFSMNRFRPVFYPHAACAVSFPESLNLIHEIV